MSEFFDEIMASIEETKEASKKKQLKETVFIRPINEYKGAKIKQIRLSLNMTQAVFAGIMGVSKKTVEAWEAGRNIPMGPASRVLDLLSEDKTVAEKFLVSH